MDNYRASAVSAINAHINAHIWGLFVGKASVYLREACIYSVCQFEQFVKQFVVSSSSMLVGSVTPTGWNRY